MNQQISGKTHTKEHMLTLLFWISTPDLFGSKSRPPATALRFSASLLDEHRTTVGALPSAGERVRAPRRQPCRTPSLSPRRRRRTPQHARWLSLAAAMLSGRLLAILRELESPCSRSESSPPDSPHPLDDISAEGAALRPAAAEESCSWPPPAGEENRRRLILPLALTTSRCGAESG